MKLNLLYHGDELRSGYVNVDPYADDNSPTKVKAELSDLNKVASDAECTDIIAIDVIDHFNSTQVDAVLDHWLSKLRHKGTITVGGTDLSEISESLYVGNINIDEANSLLFGNQGEDWEFKKSCVDIESLIMVLKAKGLKILKKRTNHYKYIVQAQRP